MATTTTPKRPVITGSKALRLNKQAEHLKASAISLDNAVLGLINEGVHVLRFSAGVDQMPEVEVEYSRNCRVLQGAAVSERRGFDGIYYMTAEVFYNGCKVYWRRELRA